MEQQVFKAGIPTDADVKRLRMRFPDVELRNGATVGYSDIENTIGCPRGSSRWATVTARWRKLIEKESGIVLKPMRGVEFKVADDADKVQLSSDKSATAFRYAKRSVQLSSLVNRNALTEDQKRRYDTTLRVTSSVLGLQEIRKHTPELPTI